MNQERMPSNLEMTVLSLLWEHGEMTARQVLDNMPDQKHRAYTSILSVLQVMEKKGLVEHDTRGTVHWFRPRVNRRKVMGPLFRNLIRNLFGGNTVAAMQCFLEEGDVQAQDLNTIQQLIQNYQEKES